MSIMALHRLISVVVWLHLWLSLARSADFTKSECFDSTEPDTQGSITITCPDNYVISMDAAYFGSNKWGACIITEDDCVEQTKIFQVCDGQMNCTRTFKTFTKTCGYSTMLVLGYSCIKSFTDLSTVPSDSVEDTDDLLGYYPPDDVDKPQEFPTNSRQTPEKPGSKSSSKDNEELGLIIGCAIASFITVVFLVIAIVMVIRRLLQNDEKDRPDNGSRPTGDCGPVCISLDCFPCIGRPETPRKNSHDLRMRKKAALESSPQLDQSKPRVAPVGEESLADQNTALSDGQDSTCSGSSTTTEDGPALQPSLRHGKLHPDKPLRQKQQHLSDKHSQQGKNIRDSFSKPSKSHGKDHDYDKALPSSSNNNLQTSGDDMVYPLNNNLTQAGHMTSPSQHKCAYDAVAIPNTLARSTC